MMFGLYGDFPRNVHKITHFAAPASSRRLQQNLIQLLHKLNITTVRGENAGMPSVANYETVFELGIAEDNGFNYLNDEETMKALKLIQKSSLHILDFLCVTRYYRVVNYGRKPLKFDYWMLRFTFNPKFLEIQLFHERGPMHILPEELIDFVVNKVNETLHGRVLKPLRED